MAAPAVNPSQTDRSTPPATALIRVCPECAGPLARAAGCLTCLQCGWGRCG